MKFPFLIAVIKVETDGLPQHACRKVASSCCDCVFLTMALAENYDDDTNGALFMVLFGNGISHTPSIKL